MAFMATAYPQVFQEDHEVNLEQFQRHLEIQKSWTDKLKSEINDMNNNTTRHPKKSNY